MVICLEQGADLHMAQLMPLSLIVSCSSKIQIGFTFLVLAHPGSPGKRAVKRCVLYACSAISTQTNPFNGSLSGTAWVSQYQKGKTNLDFTEARDSEWQWHQLGHMQTICTSLQTANYASTPPLSLYRLDAQPCQSNTISR